MLSTYIAAAIVFGLLGTTAQAADRTVPTKVTIDKHNRLSINGKLWFPICISAGPPPLGAKSPDGRDALEVLADAGIDSFRVSVPDAEDLHTVLPPYLDWAVKHGMYCFPNLDELTVFEEKAANRPERLRAMIEKFMYHPALAVWKCKDEPAWGGASIPGLKQAYDFIKKIDPHHPVWMTHAPRNTLELLREYSVACDIVALDIYPISEPPGKHSHLPNKQLSVVGDYTQWIRKAVYDKKPAWMVLQVCWSGVVPPKNRLMFPDFHQQRFMTYQAIINGARGLLYFGPTVALEGKNAELGYNWTFQNEVLTPLLKEFNRDSELYPVILASESKARLKTSGADDVEFCAREVGDWLYILACKREGAKADIKFSGELLNGEITVLYENRTVKAQKGSFSDSFGPNDVHVYKVRVK